MARRAVVLVHGLWAPAAVMWPLAVRLRAAGHEPHRFDYPGRRGTLSANARRLAAWCTRIPGERIDFVGHSLGGLLVLRLAADGGETRIGRVVLLGAPYAGCRTAQWARRVPGGAALLGRGIAEWLECPRPPLPAGLEIGVLAGTLPVGLGVWVHGLRRPSDGVVAVEETRLPGMRDFVTVRVAHGVMTVSRGVARQVVAFLRDGRFEHEA
jgi:pimeloyl-ACP methyl ester carboxylesterase